MNGQKPSWPTVTLVVLLLGGSLVAGSGALDETWDPIAQLIGLGHPPVPASANVLSEHETEQLVAMSPQDQACLLLERAINHYHGAGEQIAVRVDSWRGHLTLDQRLDGLFRLGINSDDLTVRVAALEVDIAARNLRKDVATVDRLEAAARTGAQGPRVNAMWDLALVGNRGVAPERVFDILRSNLHDPNENIRYWAVEGLAYLGTDAGLQPLLEVFRDDPLPMIRERAACSLAQSGMFSAEQRRRVVPQLIDLAGDGALDETTRGWVYQALRDITGASLPHDPESWRAGFGRAGGQR